MGKAPVVLTRYLLEWLSQSVGQCVRNSFSLTHLELDGIPFPPDCIAVLCVGLSGTETLHHLSLRRCCIGDDGCELICRTIADIRSVRSLNLSHCDLTSGCGGALANALSRQKLTLYHDTWKQSLRYREPNLETMPGLRRLTLNDNPHLGNCAVREIIEAIRDSLWMKALDLQRCGLTDQIGADLLKLLDQNNTLAVLDVRKNVNLNEELAAEVMRRLEGNNVEVKSEYKWIGLAPRDQRTASAGTRKSSEQEEAKPSRPQSAFTGHTRRSRQVIPPRRTAPAPVLPTNKVKPRASSPPVRDNVQRSNLRPRMINDVRPMSKVSLHLDLQSRVRPAVNRTSDRDSSHRLEQEKNPRAPPSTRSCNGSKVDAGTQSVDQWQDLREIQGILKRLAEARAERERLLEEVKRADLLLVEERARREIVEMKLRSVRDNMAELENALKKKENETSGYLLVSQQSLNEICLSFDRLLELLENIQTGNRSSGRMEDSHQIASAEYIKRRLARVIGQTKSENLKRGYKINVQLPKYAGLDSARKYVKSESDVRSILPIPGMYLERKIGEGPAISPATRHQSCDDTDKPISSGERARAIFASIVSGAVVLDFC